MKKIALGLLAALTLLVAGCGKQTSDQETPSPEQFFANTAVARGLITNAKVKMKHETTFRIPAGTIKANVDFNGRIDRNPTMMLGHLSTKLKAGGQTAQDESKFFLDKKGTYAQVDDEWVDMEDSLSLFGLDTKAINDLAFGPNITGKKTDWIKKTLLSRDGANYIVNFKLNSKEVNDYMKIGNMTENIDSNLTLRSLDFRVVYDGKTYRPIESRIKFNYQYDDDILREKNYKEDDVSYSQVLTFELSDYNKAAIKKPDVSDAKSAPKNSSGGLWGEGGSQ